MEKINCIICDNNKTVPFIKLHDRLSQNQETFQLVKCECGFVFLSPRPDSGEISVYYQYSEYDPHTSGTDNSRNKIYQLVQRFTMQWKQQKITSFYRSGKLLDIGGGKGEFAAYMASRGWDVVCQDRLTDKLNMNTSREIKSVVDLTKIEDEGCFDVITLWHSLEHIHDISKLYFHINRLLSKDGILLIAVPNLQAPERSFYSNKWAAFDAPRHLYHFHAGSLMELCNKYKFTVLRKFSLFQDTPYNILLSMLKFNPVHIIKGILIFIYSFIITLLRGPDYSSSILIICRKS